MHLVIFDCDGTLVDSQHNITTAMSHAFTAHGLEPPGPREILGGVGLSLTEAFQRLAPDVPEDIRKQLADRYRNAFAGQMLERRGEMLYPGIRQTVDGLMRRDDVILGIATGKSRRGVARLLAEQGWDGAFFTIQTADDHPSKPHPSMIMRAMAEAGIGPEATVMVGDTTFDVEMALGARVGAIGVGWGYHPPDRLQAAGAHDIVTAGERLTVAIEQLLASRLSGGGA